MGLLLGVVECILGMWCGGIVLLTKTGPRCISFRCKITVSLAQGAVNDAEADVADPVFVRSTIRVVPRVEQSIWHLPRLCIYLHTVQYSANDFAASGGQHTSSCPRDSS